MVDDATRARMEALEKRLAKARREQEPEPRSDEGYSRGEVAWRMVIELVTGLGIGFGIGYGLDSLFGTMPIFLVLFVLLGFAAGINVMMRTARGIQADMEPREEKKRDDDGGSDR